MGGKSYTPPKQQPVRLPVQGGESAYDFRGPQGRQQPRDRMYASAGGIQGTAYTNLLKQLMGSLGNLGS